MNTCTYPFIQTEGDSMSNYWKKGYQMEEITAEFEKARMVNQDGTVSFQMPNFGVINTLEAVAVSAFAWNSEIPGREKRNIVWRGLIEAGTQGAITPDSLGRAIKQSQSVFLALPRKKYVFLTSLSIRHSASLGRKRLGDSTILFESRRPAKFSDPRQSLSVQLFEYPAIPADYLLVRIHVSGRNPNDAVTRAFRDFDLLRGIWNLAVNRGQPWRMSSSYPRKPVNRIVLGPVHTLHLPNGDLAVPQWWYEPNFQKPIKAFDFAKYQERLFRFEGYVRRDLKRVPYREDLETAIINYGRALDLSDWNAAFLQLWSVLEALTFTEKERYDVTIRRASFIWRENRFHRQILLHLRDLRNSFVHENSGDDEIETLMYDLKRYVEALIQFHLAVGKKFSDKTEMKDFLQLSQDVDTLDHKLRLFNKAKRFRSGFFL